VRIFSKRRITALKNYRAFGSGFGAVVFTLGAGLGFSITFGIAFMPFFTSFSRTTATFFIPILLGLAGFFGVLWFIQFHVSPVSTPPGIFQ
jgi:hypothetical protein